MLANRHPVSGSNRTSLIVPTQNLIAGVQALKYSRTA